MRILIIDDHQLFIDGIRRSASSLNEDVDIFEAHSLGHAILFMELLTNLDLVLLDLHIFGLDGLSIIRHHRPHPICPPLVIISDDSAPRTIQAVLDKGVMGFIPKSYSGKKFFDALHTILDGEIYIPEIKNTPVSAYSYKPSYNNVTHGNGITKR